MQMSFRPSARCAFAVIMICTTLSMEIDLRMMSSHSASEANQASKW